MTLFRPTLYKVGIFFFLETNMIPVNSNEMVKTLGVQNKEQSEFKMNFNAQVADILSSTLYKHRDLAVIRELISNALDSHVAAKVTEPIKVTLPTKEFPTFIVEDFGVGMSKEFLLDLYSTYFFSSKRETNDEVGGFGLGSKSPFAVSSSFNVLSRKDGMETHISCSKLGDNTPKVVVLSHKPTDKPNGTTVTVPFGEVIKDSRQFYAMGYEQWVDYNLFPTCPVEFYHTIQDITSTSKKFIKTIDVSTENIIKNRDVFIESGVVYGYWYYRLPSLLPPRSEKYYTKKPLVIRIPVGKLELTPSREHLTESQHNSDVIYEICEEIYQNALSEFKKKFPNALPWDLYIKMYEEGEISKERIDLTQYNDKLRVYSQHGWKVLNKCTIAEFAFVRNTFVKSSKVASPKPFNSDTCTGNLFVGNEEMYEELSKLITFDEVLTAKEYSKYRKPKEVRVYNGGVFVNSNYLNRVDDFFLPKNFLDRFSTVVELRNKSFVRGCCVVNTTIYPKIKEAFKEANVPFKGEAEFIERLKKENYITKSELQKEHLSVLRDHFFRYNTELVILSDDEASELKEMGFPFLTADSPILKQIIKKAVMSILKNTFTTTDLDVIKNTLEYLDE